MSRSRTINPAYLLICSIPIRYFRYEACSFYMNRVDQHVLADRLTKFQVLDGESQGNS